MPEILNDQNQGISMISRTLNDPCSLSLSSLSYIYIYNIYADMHTLSALQTRQTTVVTYNCSVYLAFAWL